MGKESHMSELLDLLLRPEAPDVVKQLPEKRVEVKRLTRLLGEPVIFRLKGLPYGRVEELRKLEEGAELQILLAGCEALRDPALLAKYGAPTPAEAAKRLLLPGEIADMSREVERLCGYRERTIREVKNA